jgi:hypothetical protein
MAASALVSLPGLGCGLGHINGLPPEQWLPVRTSAGLWYHLVWLRPILAEKYTTHSLAVDLERTKIEAWKRTSRASRRIDG